MAESAPRACVVASARRHDHRETQGRPQRRAIGVRAAVGLLRTYQRLISPLLPPTCRFYPSCSEYALQSIVRHGLARGGWLALRRLCRCHPLHPGGFDPVH